MYACYIHICIYIPTGEPVGVVHVCSDEEVEGVGGDGHAEEGLPREARRPVRADLLERVEDAAERGVEGGSHACLGGLELTVP